MKNALMAIFAAALFFSSGAKAYTYDLSGLSLYVVNPNEQVTVTYLEKNAAFTHLLDSNVSNLIVDTGNESTGKIFDLGTFSAGTEIIFDLYVKDTGNTFYSGPASNNVDNVVHAGVDTTTFGSNTVALGFEDLILENTDNDYNDVIFKVSNVTTVSAVPEPSTYALMLAGLGLVGFMARRRQQA